MAASLKSAEKTTLSSPNGIKAKDKGVHDSVINRYDMYGHQNQTSPLVSKFHKEEVSSTYVDKKQRREIYDFMQGYSKTNIIHGDSFRQTGPQPAKLGQDVVDNPGFSTVGKHASSQGRSNRIQQEINSSQRVHFGTEQSNRYRQRDKLAIDSMSKNEQRLMFINNLNDKMQTKKKVHSTNVSLGTDPAHMGNGPKKTNSRNFSQSATSKGQTLSQFVAKRNSAAVDQNSNFEGFIPAENGVTQTNPTPSLMAESLGNGVAAQTIVPGDLNFHITNFQTQQKQMAKNKELKQECFIDIKFKEGVYTKNSGNSNFKPTYMPKENLTGKQQAEYQGALEKSSIQFYMEQTQQEQKQKVTCKPDELPSEAGKRFGKFFDKHSKMHLTQQAATNGAWKLQQNKNNEQLGVSNFGGGAQHYNTISHNTQAKNQANAPKAAEKQRNKEELDKHYQFHKGTTYTIGKSGSVNAKAFNSLSTMDFVEKPRNTVMNSRFNQEEATGIPNQNLRPNYEIGLNTVSVRGQDKDRKTSTYVTQTNTGGKIGYHQTHTDKNRNNSDAMNGEFNLSSKFSVGFDANPDARSHTTKKADEQQRAVNDCLKNSLIGHKQREEIKRNTENQNFHMLPSHKHMNSETKRVGDAGNTFIRNEANQDLKVSHMPFAALKGQMAQSHRSGNFSPGVQQGTAQVRADSLKLGRFNSQFKGPAEQSRLPFAKTERFGADGARNQYETFSKTQFNWKSPTFMK